MLPNRAGIIGMYHLAQHFSVEIICMVGLGELEP
jgi:hypothetical protein